MNVAVLSMSSVVPSTTMNCGTESSQNYFARPLHRKSPYSPDKSQERTVGAKPPPRKNQIRAEDDRENSGGRHAHRVRELRRDHGSAHESKGGRSDPVVAREQWI